MSRSRGTALVLSALAVLAAIFGRVWYFAFLPLSGYTGPLAPLSIEERTLAATLRRHVVAVASEPHNTAHPAALEASAICIERQLAMLGLPVERQEDEAAGQKVSNIHVDAPGTQRFPFPVGLLYRDVGNFFAFVGLRPARTLVHEAVAAFRHHTHFPSIGGIAHAFVPGIALPVACCLLPAACCLLPVACCLLQLKPP